MSDKAAEHQRVIVDQFTKQAIPFSLMPDHSPELVLAASEVAAHDTVLDVACGPGLMACEFASVARHVTGIDLTPAMIEQAKNRQRTKEITNITWQVGDVVSLPFVDASFSLIFTRYSLHHFLDPQAVVAEMARVCSPNGRVVVVDVFTSSSAQAEAYNHMEKLRDPSHVRALSLDELIQFFGDANLRDVKTQFYRHAFELDQVLLGSFPMPGDADRVRRIFADDNGSNRLGLDIQIKDGRIHFAYPIVILVGHKS